MERIALHDPAQDQEFGEFWSTTGWSFSPSYAIMTHSDWLDWTSHIHVLAKVLLIFISSKQEV